MLLPTDIKKAGRRMRIVAISDAIHDQGRLTGTCNVLDADSAVASPCAEKVEPNERGNS